MNNNIEKKNEFIKLLISDISITVSTLHEVTRMIN